MKYNPLLHHRRSIRLAGYDYTQSGEYFLTLCTHDHTRASSNPLRLHPLQDDKAKEKKELIFEEKDIFLRPQYRYTARKG